MRKTILIWGALLANTALAQPLDVPFANSGDAPFQLQMTPGQVQILRVPDVIGDMLIGNSEMLDVNVMGERTVALTAKDQGLSTLVFIGKDRVVIGAVDVISGPRERHGKALIRILSGQISDPKQMIHERPIAEYLCDAEGRCAGASTNQPRAPSIMYAPGTVIESSSTVNGPAGAATYNSRTISRPR